MRGPGPCLAMPLRLVAALALLLGAASAHATSIVYPESGGQVVVEAEGFSFRSDPVDLPEGTVSGDLDQWLIVPGEYAGSHVFSNPRGSFLQLSDAGGPQGEGVFTTPGAAGPYVDYRVQISSTGTYELYARWDSPGTLHNSFYARVLNSSNVQVGSLVTFNGGATDNIDRDFATDPWDDINALFAIGLPGLYTIRIHAREDGAAIDTLVFQHTELAAPTGQGPLATTGVVPEPGAAALLLLGALGALAARRRS